jgi:ABC-2 type transport system permease protein
VGTGIALGFDPVGGIDGIAGGILVACLFALFAAGLGLIIGILAKTEGAATGASLTIVMIMAFFSGLFIPLEVMPSNLQVMAQLFPSYYANDAVKSLIARGAPLFAPQVLLDIGVILIFSGIVFLAGWLAFRRKYD